MHREINEFIKTLKQYHHLLSRRQFKSLKGQAISGNIEAAYKGLETATGKWHKEKEILLKAAGNTARTVELKWMN